MYFLSLTRLLVPFRFQVTGLIEGQWYAYRVKALNRLGASKPCKATDEILAVDPKGMFCINAPRLYMYCE